MLPIPPQMVLNPPSFLPDQESRAAPQLPRDVGDIISMMENWDNSHSPPCGGWEMWLDPWKPLTDTQLDVTKAQD